MGKTGMIILGVHLRHSLGSRIDTDGKDSGQMCTTVCLAQRGTATDIELRLWDALSSYRSEWPAVWHGFPKLDYSCEDKS